jgi:hypothetical protein
VYGPLRVPVVPAKAGIQVLRILDELGFPPARERRLERANDGGLRAHPSPSDINSVTTSYKDITSAMSVQALHGITLESVLTRLVEHYGWDELGRRIEINCFIKDPSIKSSLKFLRKTPWAREQVEKLYLETKFTT